MVIVGEARSGPPVRLQVASEKDCRSLLLVRMTNGPHRSGESRGCGPACAARASQGRAAAL